MISILMKLIEESLSKTAFLFPVLILLLAIVGILTVHRKVSRLPGYLLKSAIAESCILFFMVVLLIIRREGIKAKLPQIMGITSILTGLAVATGLLFVALAGYTIQRYVSVNCALKAVMGHSQRDNYEHNPIQAWRELNDLKPSRMTGKQFKRYRQYRMFLCAGLGCFSANERELEQMEKGSRKQAAFCHFLRFFQKWSAGDMDGAAEQIQIAETLCNADTDVMIRAQILINRGVGYIGQGLYKDADDALARAIEFCEKNKIRDVYLWTTIYYNYVFNKTRVNPDITQEEWETELQNLKLHLDMEKPVDYMAYFNVELELLRQTKADKKELEEKVYYAFDYMKQSNIPEKNRCRLEASFARIIWAGRLDPTFILPALTEDLELLKQMPMPSRYGCFKEIDLFFADLHGGIVEEYDRLKQTAYWYMTNQAEKDLEEYRRSLPTEAIYERCYCFKEIAGLQKRKGEDYRWEVVEENFQNAVALYHENGLELEEIMCKLDLIDEASGIFNTDEHLRLLRKKEMQQMIGEVEAFLPHIKRHPIMNEVALRLSFYCGAVDDYDQCKQYYELFKKTGRNLSMEHYAPWLHRYYMVVCFLVRVQYILDAIEQIPKQDTFPQESESVRTWFEGFGQRNGESESFILGRLLGFSELVMLKRVVWQNPQTNQQEYHAWLVFPQIKMEIDVTYTSISGEEGISMFFPMGQHPMENGNSRFVREKEQTASQIGTFGLGNFPPAMQQAMLRICQLVEEALPPQCPTIQELQEVYGNVMLPVSAVGISEADEK